MKDYLLKSVPVFQDVKIETLIRLEKFGKLQKIPKGQMLYRAKEPVSKVFIQLSGKSIIYNLTRSGKRKILFVLGPGCLLNENVVAEKDYSFYCETIEKSEIFAIPAEDFMFCMEADFSLVRVILTAQERKVWRLGHQLKNTMGSIYMERKLASKLWKLQRDFGIPVETGVEIDMDLPITFLADMMGAPRETVSKTCKILVEKGFVEMNKKRITVIDPERLSEFYHTGELE